MIGGVLLGTPQGYFHDALRTGVTIPEALKIAGRSHCVYESRRRDDAEFKKLTDEIRERVKNPEGVQ